MFSKFLQKKDNWFYLLVIASLALHCIALGQVPLRDWDEGTYAIISREMSTTGNWLYPTLHNAPFWEKPPLVYWLVAASYHLSGVSELTSRLVLASLSSLAVPLLYQVGWEVFGRHSPALLSAIVYLTTLPVVRHGRLVMHDGLAVTCFLIALLCLLRGRRHPIYLLGFGIGMGLVVLSKGLLAILLGVIILVFCLFSSLGPLWANSWFLLGIGLGALPVLGWYGLQWHIYGADFLRVHFLNHGLDRVSKDISSNTGPIWYYLLEIIKYSGIWLAFIPAGLCLAWHQRQELWAKLVLVGFIGYLGSISVMTTKLPWYVIPIYSFVSLAVGAKLDQIWYNPRNQRWLYSIWLAFWSLLTCLGFIYFLYYEQQVILILTSASFSVALIFSSWFAYRSRGRYIILTAAATYGALLSLMLSPVWLWELNEAFPVKEVASIIKHHTPPSSVIYTSFSYSRPSLNFYSERIVKSENLERLKEIWSTASSNYFLLDPISQEKLNLTDIKILNQTDQFVLLTKN